MPEITEEEMAELNRLRSSSVTQELDLAKANFRAENPHIPSTFLDTWQGDPTDLPKFGETLLAQFPKPTAPAPTTTTEVAPVTQVPPATLATPAVPQMVVPPAPIPGASALAATTQPPPMTPEAYKQAYEQAAAQGRPLQSLEQMQAAARPVAPIPAPGIGDALTQQNANAQQSDTVRERMRIGVATPAEVQWLSQNGDKGFVAAMTQHARKVQAAVGGRA